LPLGRVVEPSFGYSEFEDVLVQPFENSNNTVDELIDQTGQRELYERLVSGRKSKE
jgi:hypothetical protein